jgi:hypothetical protein
LDHDSGRWGFQTLFESAYSHLAPNVSENYIVDSPQRLTEQSRVAEAALHAWTNYSDVSCSITSNALTIAWNSRRSFCIGVPLRMILLLVFSTSNILVVLLSNDFNL